MKRILLCGLMSVLCVGGPAGPALAAPVRMVSHAASLMCPLLAGPGGTANLFVGYTEDGSLASSTVWRPGDTPGEDQAWLEGVSEEPVVDGSALHVTIGLFDQSAGLGVEGVVDAVLAPDGSATTVTERRRDGNTWSRSSVTTTPATVTGTYSVPGVGVFDLSACVAELIRVEDFSTQPPAYVVGSRYVEMSCQFDSGDEDVAVFAWELTRSGEAAGDLSLAVFPHVGGEESSYFGSGPVTISRRSISGAVALTDSSDTPVGTATVTAQLSVADVERIRSTEDGTTSSGRIETLAIDGTLTMPDGRILSLDGCTATRATGLFRTHPGA